MQLNYTWLVSFWSQDAHSLRKQTRWSRKPLICMVLVPFTFCSKLTQSVHGFGYMQMFNLTYRSTAYDVPNIFDSLRYRCISNVIESHQDCFILES